ncbi:MAG: hypothetical protein Q9206_005113 [Seirophora lacunosa]
MLAFGPLMERKQTMDPEGPQGTTGPIVPKGPGSKTEDNTFSSEEKKPSPNGSASQAGTANYNSDTTSLDPPDSRHQKDTKQAGDGDDDGTSTAEQTTPTQNSVTSRPGVLMGSAEPSATSGALSLPSLPPSTAAAAGDVPRGAAAAALLGSKAHHLVGLLLGSCVVLRISSFY